MREQHRGGPGEQQPAAGPVEQADQRVDVGQHDPAALRERRAAPRAEPHRPRPAVHACQRAERVDRQLVEHPVGGEVGDDPGDLVGREPAADPGELGDQPGHRARAVHQLGEPPLLRASAAGSRRRRDRRASAASRTATPRARDEVGLLDAGAQLGLARAGLSRSATAAHSPGSAGPTGCPGARPASASHTLIRVSTTATAAPPSARIHAGMQSRPIIDRRRHSRPLPDSHARFGRPTGHHATERRRRRRATRPTPEVRVTRHYGEEELPRRRGVTPACESWCARSRCSY